jgi:hypothetical protein
MSQMGGERAYKGRLGKDRSPPAGEVPNLVNVGSLTTLSRSSSQPIQRRESTLSGRRGLGIGLFSSLDSFQAVRVEPSDTIVDPVDGALD